MKKAENKEYLIINTENRYYLYPFYIFDKITGEVITANKSEMENYIKKAIDKSGKDIGLLCIKGGLI